MKTTRNNILLTVGIEPKQAEYMKNTYGNLPYRRMRVSKVYYRETDFSCPGEYLYSRHGQIAEEVNKRLSGKEEEEMTQTEFNEKFKIAMNEYRKSLQDNDCGEWSAEAREWAIRVGLFAGNGTTVDGQPNMMWADPLTREQAAVLFYRFAKEHGLA